MPSASALSATASLPTRWRARIAGMLSEYWSARRTRTGPAVELIGVARRPVLAAIELGRDVEQEAARRQGVVVEGRGVDDRLPGRSRLARAGARGVVLRVELPARHRIAVVRGAAGVGEHVAGLVVDRDERRVVEILAAQGVDPGAIALADLVRVEDVLRLGRLQVGRDRRGSEPAFGLGLDVPVERRDDLVAAGSRPAPCP